MGWVGVEVVTKLKIKTILFHFKSLVYCTVIINSIYFIIVLMTALREIVVFICSREG